LLTDTDLKRVLHESDVSREDILLLCLAVGMQTPKQIRDLQRIAESAGRNEVKRWNCSDILRRAKGRAFRTRAGWELAEDGKKRVRKIISQILRQPTSKLLPTLRAHLTNIHDPDIAKLALEAIQCCEARLSRAAVVLSWVGAVALLYDYVVKSKLSEFNKDAQRRFSNWKPAKTADDLANMSEYNFLQVLHAVSVIGKNVKQELEARLKLRNACGHPSSLKVSETMVAAHVESLIVNVFSRFA